MELVVRTNIGPYQMTAHLDSGGMADVYLGHGDDPGSPVVIKVMRPQHRGVAEIVEMFREEARVMQRLSHRNVVQVMEYGEEDGCPWIAMEYLEGDHLGTLVHAARRQRRPLSPSLVARIGLEVSRGLAYVHGLSDLQGRDLGLVHRDVSPQNIFLCYSGDVKILDFGIAKAVDREEATRTGLLKGKLAYLSPEQVRHEQLDKRSDLFSLGIVLWELIVGRRLFRTKNEYDTMKRICEVPAPPVGDLRSGVPPALTSIVARLLRRSLKARFQTADELAHGLEGVLDRLSAPEDEPFRIARQLLSKRKKQKTELLCSVRREGELQLRLFGDLVDSLDQTGSDSLSLEPNRPTSGPDRIRARLMDPDIAAAPLVEQEEISLVIQPAGDESSPKAKRPWNRRAVLILTGLLTGALVGVGLLTWLWSGPEERKPIRVAPPDATQAGPARQDGVIRQNDATRPTGVLVTSSPLKRRRAKGQISIRVDRAVEASLGKRKLGRTPVERLPLQPGQYKILLTDPGGPSSRRLTVNAERGKHTTYRVTF